MAEAVSEIISSSSWLRTPLSRKAKYAVERREIQNNSKGQVNGVEPQVRWYYHIGKKSRGQTIGNIISIGFLGWFIADLVKRWGEGRFWKRFGLLVASSIGAITSASTRTVQDLFSVDLFTSAILKGKDQFKAFISSFKTEDEAENAIWEELKGIAKELKKPGSRHIIPIPLMEDFSGLLSACNKLLEKFGIKFESSEPTEKSPHRFFVLSKDLFSLGGSTTYTPFVSSKAVIERKIKEFFTRMPEAQSKIKDPQALGKYAGTLIEEMLQDVSLKPSIGYFETKDGIKSEYQINQDPNLLLGESYLLGKTFMQWISPFTSGVVKVS